MWNRDGEGDQSRTMSEPSKRPQPALDTAAREHWVDRVFPGLPAPIRTATARSLRPVHVARGEVIVREGDPSEDFYIVVAGEVGVTRARPNGTESRVALLGPGQFLGEMSLLAGTERTATVRAETEAVLLALDGDAFRAMFAAGTTLPAAPPSGVALGGATGDGPTAYWQTTWAAAVRAACRGLVAARGMVASFDLCGGPAEVGGGVALLLLTDLSRRVAAEYGLEVRASIATNRTVIHIAARAQH